MLNRSPFWSLITIGFSLVFITCAEAKPHGFHLKSGDARAPVQENGAWVVHSGKKALIDWENFSIDQKEILRFQQMDGNSYVLNRVVGGKESVLLGQLLSNGAVYLINPQGILIGPNAYIETAGFIASTLDVLSEDLAGKTVHFAGDSGKGVVNQGIIHCPAGDIFLIGHHVENSGALSSPEGRQGLLAGCDVIIQPKGVPQVQIHSDQIIDPQELAENPYAAAIRLRGSSVAQEAYFVTEKGLCEISGSITTQNGDKGGHVRILGEDVHLLNGARIEASGQTGGGEVLIGGDYQGKNPEINNAKHVWAGQDTEVRADALQKGEGGKVIFWSDEATLHYGKISIRGGPEGGDGGLAEVSGKMLEYRGFTDGRAACGKTGTLLLDPNDITIGTTATTGSFTGCGTPPSTYTITTGTPTNQILYSDLNTQLVNCNVTISTVGSTGSGTFHGGIIVSAGANAVSWNTPNTLTLTASAFVLLSSAVTSTHVGAEFTAMNFTGQGISTGASSGITLGSGGVLTSASGDVFLNGTASTATNAGSGILFNSGSIVTASGNISLTGIVPVGSTSATSYGINMSTINGITSTSGNITVSGTSSSSGTNVYGFSSASDAWTTGTTGTVTFTNCVGGSGLGSAGVSLNTFSTSGSVVATNMIQAGSGNSSIGFSANSFTAAGNIQITATNSSTTGSAHGIQIGGPMSSGGGSITLNGTSGAGTTSSYGIDLFSPISTTGSGSISLTGAASGSASSNGIYLGTPNPLTTATGSITLSGTSSASGSNSHGINVNSSWTPSTSGTVTFSNCSGGSGTASHGVNLGSAFTGSGNVTFTNCTGGNSATIGGNGINIAAAFTTTGAITAITSILGQGNGGVGFASNFNFSTTGITQAINITASANGTTGAAHGISLTGGTLSNSGGGGITLNGTGGTSSTASHGINLSGGLISTPAGNGAISLTGNASGSAAGIGILSASTNSITSASGSITLNGTSIASVAGADGVSITSAWSPSTSNTLSLTGTGGSTGPSYGISITGALNVSGPLTLNGTAGGGAGTYAYGIGSSMTTQGSVLTIPGTTFITGTATLDTTNNGSTPAGASISFSSTIDGANALTLKAGTSGSVTFGGVVGGTTGLGALTITNAKTSANAVNISSNITASSFIITTASPITLTGSSTIQTSTGTGIAFGGTIDGTMAGSQALTLTANGGGTISLSQAVGGTTSLASLSASGGTLTQSSTVQTTGQVSYTETTLINADGNITTSGGIITMTGPVSIANTPSFNTTTGAPAGANISFSNTLNGATALTLNAGTGGTVSFSGAVGGTAPPTNLIFSNANLIQIGNNITVSGANPLSFPSSVSLTGTSNITSNNNNITFSNTLNGAQALTLTGGTGTVSFVGAVGAATPLTSLSATAATITQNSTAQTTGAFSYTGSTAINVDGNITTSGGIITMTGPVSIANTPSFNTTIGAPAGANISFSNTLNGATALTLNAGTGGIVSFSGAVGGTAPPTNLIFSNANFIQIGNNITVSGANPLSFPSPITLTGTSNITSNNNNITFSNPLNGAQALTLTGGTGTVSFVGTVGAATPLTSLSATAATITQNSTAQTTGAFSYTGSTAINVDGNITTSGGIITMMGPVNIANTPSFNTTTGAPAGANISFSNTLNGATALTLNAGTGRTVSFSGAVGATTPLTSLSATAATITQNSTVQTTGAFSYTGSTAINVDGNITTSGGIITMMGPVNIANTPSFNTTTGAPAGANISFSNTLNGATALTLNAGTGRTISFSGAVGAATPLTSLSATAATITQNSTAQTTGAFSYTGSTAINVDGNITTSSGIITMTGPVNIANTPSFNTTTGAPAGANISFSNTLNGATALTLNAGTGGTVSFSGAVGAATPLTSLSATAATITQNSTVQTTGAFSYTGSTAINVDGNITTSGGMITMTGPVSIANTPSFNTTIGVSAGANISFSNTLNGATALTLNAGTGGTVSFSGAVGGTAPPTNLIFSNANLIQMGNNITVSGANPLSFPSPVSLTGTSNITSNNNNITFSSTLNGAQALTLTGGTGTVSFVGAVGGTAPLTNLVFTSANLIDVGSNITITGANPLSFPSPVGLTGSSTITSNSANVTFLSTLNGAQTLTVTEGTGTTAFDGNVGGTTPLGALSISGVNGNFSVGSAVTTIRASSFSVGNTIPTTLDNTALLTIDTSSGNGLISFASPVNGTSIGAQSLALNAGTGNITLSSFMGNTVPLGALTVVDATNVTASGSIAATSLTQSAGSGTTLFDGILTIGSDVSLTGNNFTFNVPEVAANNVTVDNSGLLSVPVSAFFSLNGAFLQSGTGPVQIQGNILTANQSITFDSGVTLLGNANFNTGGAPGNIVFGSTVDGAHNLTLNAGDVGFGGIVGSTPLNSLSVTAAGTITTAGNQTVAVGPMIYNGNVILTANTQFLDNGTNPMMFETISGDSIAGNFNLILRAPNSNILVESDIVLSGSSGSAGGSCTGTAAAGLVLSGQILTQGGNAAPGTGGHGGLVTLNATAGSISVHNINTSGGNGTVSGGSAGNILIQPASGYSSGLPIGIIVLNNDLSGGQNGNLVALAGSGGGGLDGTITLSANRSSPATVATITSSDIGNDIFISGLNFVMGNNEAMTGLGNITLSCPQATLGDLVALDSLMILATDVTLLTHGDESILDKFGNLYTSPSLHFLGGSGYVQTGTLNPPGPLNAQDLGLSSATFRPLLILGDPVILNFDTAPRPPPPAPFVVSKHAKEYAIYKLMIADAELSDLLPVGPCPEPYKLRKEQERCPLPMSYKIRKKEKEKAT